MCIDFLLFFLLSPAYRPSFSPCLPPSFLASFLSSILLSSFLFSLLPCFLPSTTSVIFAFLSITSYPPSSLDFFVTLLLPSCSFLLTLIPVLLFFSHSHFRPALFLSFSFLSCSLPLTSIGQDFESERGQSANPKIAQFGGKPTQHWTSSSLRSSPTGGPH